MLFDAGIGILLAFATEKIFAFPASGIPFFILMALGVGFSLVMDGDAVIDLIIHRGTKHSYRHRDLFHRPLVYIPAGMVLVGLVTHAVYASYAVHLIAGHYILPIVLLFAACSIAHFIHDSIGIGWGVQWLWPFSTDHFSFLYQYNAHKGGFPTKLVYVWKDADIDRLEARYGDKDWFRKIYFSFHPYGLAEFAVFGIAVIAAYIALR